MSKVNAKALYEEVKQGGKKFDEEYHCTMVINIMNTDGTMAAFCRKAMISEQKFYYWVKKYEAFSECYSIGKILSRANWEEEGVAGKEDESFNMDYWLRQGAMRYGVGTPRVRMGIDASANPYEQYKQLVAQAGDAEFTASEVKQLMESINVGIRAFESFELQKKMDVMKEDVDRMRVNYHGDNSGTIAHA